MEKAVDSRTDKSQVRILWARALIVALFSPMSIMVCVFEDAKILESENGYLKVLSDQGGRGKGR